MVFLYSEVPPGGRKDTAYRLKLMTMMITKLKLCQPCLAEFLSIYFLFTKQVCLLGMTPFMAFRLTVYPNRSDRYSLSVSLSLHRQMQLMNFWQAFLSFTVFIQSKPILSNKRN